MNGGISIKFITINHQQIHMTSMTLRKSLHWQPATATEILWTR